MEMSSLLLYDVLDDAYYVIHDTYQLANGDAETKQSKKPKNQRKRRLKGGGHGRRQKKKYTRTRSRPLKDKDGNNLTSRTIPEVLAAILGDDSKGPEKRPGREGRIQK